MTKCFAMFLLACLIASTAMSQVTPLNRPTASELFATCGEKCEPVVADTNKFARQAKFVAAISTAPAAPGQYITLLGGVNGIPVSIFVLKTLGGPVVIAGRQRNTDVISGIAPVVTETAQYLPPTYVPSDAGPGYFPDGIAMGAVYPIGQICPTNTGTECQLTVTVFANNGMNAVQSVHMTVYSKIRLAILPAIRVDSVTVTNNTITVHGLFPKFPAVSEISYVVGQPGFMTNSGKVTSFDGTTVSFPLVNQTGIPLYPAGWGTQQLPLQAPWEFSFLTSDGNVYWFSPIWIGSKGDNNLF